MRVLGEIDSVDEVKQIIRDLTIQSIEGGVFTFDSVLSKEFRRWVYGYNKRKKIIHSIFKHGGVLTGSKVLNKTLINGHRLMERDTSRSDWDFIVTEENVYKITSEINFDETSNGLTYRISSSDSYGRGGQNIDLIIVSELPMTYQVGTYTYCDPLYILNQKMNFVSQRVDGYEKHESDLKKFFWKFNYLIK